MFFSWSKDERKFCGTQRNNRHKTTMLFLHSEKSASIKTEDYTEMEELDY